MQDYRPSINSVAQLKTEAAIHRSFGRKVPTRKNPRVRVILSESQTLAMLEVGWKVPFISDYKEFIPVKRNARGNYVNTKYSFISDIVSKVIKNGPLALWDLAIFVADELDPGDKGYRTPEYILQVAANRSGLKIKLAAGIIAIQS